MLSLKNVGDEDLLRQLSDLVGQSRRVEADLVSHIGEVELRRLYLQEACSSMFVYCTRVLHLSEAEAWLRIGAARASREHPILLTMLRDGRLHLSAIRRLAPHLTRENREGLLKRATHKSRREIEDLVAELAPRPDAPTVIRKLPDREVPLPVPGGLGPDPVEPSGLISGPSTVGASTRGSGPAAVSAQGAGGADPAAERRTRPRNTIEALAPGRYKVCFTANAELRDKLEELQALMRSSVPDGDLARIFDTLVTEKLERLRAKRFAQTKAPRKTLAQTDTTSRSRYIPAAVRREVYERDGGRCTFKDRSGRRCDKRHDLELHHKHGFARGGDHRPDNLTLMCELHNAYLAELDYGKEVMARFRDSSKSRTAPVDVYGDRVVVQARWHAPG